MWVAQAWHLLCDQAAASMIAEELVQLSRVLYLFTSSGGIEKLAENLPGVTPNVLKMP